MGCGASRATCLLVPLPAAGWNLQFPNSKESIKGYDKRVNNVSCDLHSLHQGTGAKL